MFISFARKPVQAAFLYPTGKLEKARKLFCCGMEPTAWLNHVAGLATFQQYAGSGWRSPDKPNVRSLLPPPGAKYQFDDLMNPFVCMHCLRAAKRDDIGAEYTCENQERSLLMLHDRGEKIATVCHRVGRTWVCFNFNHKYKTFKKSWPI